jgi:hypothetical protein
MKIVQVTRVMRTFITSAVEETKTQAPATHSVIKAIKAPATEKEPQQIPYPSTINKHNQHPGEKIKDSQIKTLS